MASTNPLLKHALKLEYLTILWNIIEAMVAIGAGWIAGSIALVGFGLDSIIEVVAASMVLWRLRCELRCEHTTHASAERLTLRVIGITFFVLAVYVGFEAISMLMMNEAPRVSSVGIVLALLSATFMPFLGLRKLWVARQLKTRALEADAIETLMCGFLSIALLLGIGLNALFGWWWADPVAAICMLPFILKEGWHAMREARYIQ